jgi:60 kDa SS-A/Ro ribonucleoprotein
MANKSLFSSAAVAARVPHVNALNAAGGFAYDAEPKQALAQIACTNCFNGTFYVSDADLLKMAQDAAQKVQDDAFLAKVAVYARKHAFMKDMPAFLCAVLAHRNPVLFRKVFRQTIDNGKMLRNFIQIARSGAAGKVLNMTSGTCHNALREWFNTRHPAALLSANIGNDPSMVDILKMSRVKPQSPETAAMLAYLRGAQFDGETFKQIVCEGYRHGGKFVTAHEHDFSLLPKVVRDFEAYKKNPTAKPPKVDFRLLDGLSNMPQEAWVEIARNANWNMTKKNLNTFKRHGVFDVKGMPELIAERLRDPEQVRQAHVFPHELLAGWKAIGNTDLPFVVKDAYQDAVDIACENVPALPGVARMLVDTSGSMNGPATGRRKGATSVVSCREVAALFASAILRKNRDATVLCFTTQVHTTEGLNARDSVLTNARALAAMPSGGTDCSCALKYLNDRDDRADLVFVLSDYESWVDSSYARKGTGLMNEWVRFTQRNRKAKLVCIDLQPRSDVQVVERSNILQVAGFSDAVFNVIHEFARGGNDKNFWVAEIDKINLDGDAVEVEDDDEE